MQPSAGADHADQVPAVRMIVQASARLCVCKVELCRAHKDVELKERTMNIELPLLWENDRRTTSREVDFESQCPPKWSTARQRRPHLHCIVSQIHLLTIWLTIRNQS